MGKIFRLVLILSILAGLSFYPAIVTDVHAATAYYVSTSGSDSATGTIGNPWRHIDYAVDNVSPGDTIYVRGGTYNERVTFGVSGSAGNWITLTNYGAETAIVDGTGISVTWIGGLLEAWNKDYIKVDGLTIQNSVAKGVYFDGCDNIEFTYNTIDGCQGNGMYLKTCDELLIDHNTITDVNIKPLSEGGGGEALTPAYCTNFEISYNHIYNTHKEVIDLGASCTNGKVHHNHIHNCPGPGIYIDAWNTTVSNIDIYDNFIHDIQPDYVNGSTYIRRGGIFLEAEVGGRLRNISIYNNLTGSNCSMGGIGLGERATSYEDIYIVNNTILQGTDTWYGGINIRPASSKITNLVIRNNILVGANVSRYMVYDNGYAGYAHSVTNNLFERTPNANGGYNYSGTGYIVGDPKFISTPGTNDNAYKLQSSSPARDNGTSSNAPSTDYWGASRPLGGAYDIGAHEYAGSAPPPNQPPVLNSIGNKSVVEGELLQFTISATDPDSSNLTYSASNLPSGANFNTTTRVFSWTPTGAGTYTNVHFQVSDGSLTDSEDITITVNAAAPPPEPPSIAFISPTDINSTTVTRDWTDVNVSVNSTIDTTSFIDWNRSLVGYWDFEENSGSSASDNSTYSNTGSLTNGPQWTTGKFGSALRFDGNNDYVDCGSNTVLNSTDEITIEAWVNPSMASEGGPNSAVLAKAQDGVGWSWQLRYNAPGGGNYLGFQFNGNPEGATWVSVKQNLTPGVWYHVVGVFDGTNIKCYLNGIETDSNQISGIVGGNSSLFIGHDGWGNVFNGNVDEAKIWNRALSSNEIKASYNSSSNSLSRQFTDLASGIYQYHAYTTDTIGNSAQTETRTLTIATGQLYEAWDVNQDGICNVLDMTLVGQHMGETGSAGWIPEDVNSDGAVDVLDMIVIGQHLVL